MKLAPHRFVLPAIWLNTVFGNQVWSPTLVAIGQIFYWASLLLAALLLCKIFNRSYLPYALVLTVVGCRIAALAGLPGFHELYIASMLVLFFSTGVALALQFPRTLESQARVFFALSLPLMFFQVAGAAEWLQTFNTLYFVDTLAGPGEVIARPEIRLLPMLFTSTEQLMATRYADFYAFLSMQVRPPGLAHSSAMLAVFVLAGAAVQLGRMCSKRTTIHDVALAAIAVLSGSKAILLGFTLLLGLAYLRSERVIRRRIGRLFLLLIMMIGIYVLVFPAAAATTLAFDAFSASFLIRAVDAVLLLAPDLVYLWEIASVVSTYSASFSEGSNVGGLSGLVGLIRILPFALAAILVVMPWLIRGVGYCRESAPRSARTSEYMLLVVIMLPFATPIVGSPFYVCCVGIALMPIAVGLSARLRSRLVGVYSTS